MESSKNNRWRRIRLQVQLRFLHRSFSASKFHNCIFDIKCCCNWTRDKGRERQSSGCFVDGSLHFLRNAILYSFSLSGIFSLFSRGSLIPCNLIRHLYLAFVFHGIKQVYFPLKFFTFSPNKRFRPEAKSDVEILEANWQTLTWLTYDRMADPADSREIPACCEKYLKDNKHNSLHLTLKICSDICPWTLSAPRSSQFSSSFALGKLFASRNR